MGQETEPIALRSSFKGVVLLSHRVCAIELGPPVICKGKVRPPPPSPPPEDAGEQVEGDWQLPACPCSLRLSPFHPVAQLIGRGSAHQKPPGLGHMLRAAQRGLNRLQRLCCTHPQRSAQRPALLTCTPLLQSFT